MAKTTILAGAVLAGSIAIASMFAAAPASAAVLPSGQRITVIDNQNNQYFVADPASAALTEVGVGGVANEQAFVNGVDVNDLGIGYAVGSYYSDGPFGGFVQTADANTGVLGSEVDVWISNGAGGQLFVDECLGIDFSSGVVLISCALYGPDDDDTTYVGEVDPATGELNPELILDDTEEGFPYLDVLAIAIDPVTGELYLFTVEFEDTTTFFGIYTADEFGLEFEAFTDGPSVGADFDRGGQLWVTTYVQDGELEASPALATVNLETGAYPFVEFYDPPADVQVFNVTSITVWGLPALAATGSTAPVAPAVAAAGILLIGSLLAAGTLMVRRRGEEPRVSA